MTTGASPRSLVSIRLVFQLERADHPRLYDDLIRFKKGVRRVSRLRLLAYDGLLAQEGVLARGAATAADVQPPRDEMDPEEGSGSITNGLFEPAIDG